MIWECVCGLSGTSKYFFVKNNYSCPICNSVLMPKEGFSLSFWAKHESFKDLSEDFLNPKRKVVLDAIKIKQLCSDRDVSVFLGIPINQVTGRRFVLANCGIPLVVPFSKVFDDVTKRWVTAWVVNKGFDVERTLERGVLT